MRKRMIEDNEHDGDQQWLDVETLAQVALTSEDAEHPIEAALSGRESGWRATRPGEQIIRLIFDEPLSVRHIRLQFEEGAARIQEFVLRCSSEFGRSHTEIVRQQYTFSAGTMRETEDPTTPPRGNVLIVPLAGRNIPEPSGERTWTWPLSSSSK